MENEGHQGLLHTYMISLLVANCWRSRECFKEASSCVCFIIVSQEICLDCSQETAHWSKWTIALVQAALLRIYELYSTKACFCSLILREAVMMCSCGDICTVDA